MEIDPVGAVHGGAVQLNVTERAQQLALAQQHAALEGVATQTTSPTVTTSITYSPSLYAQAAQYQLYTQSGTLAAMSGHVPVAAERPTSADDDIHAVEGVEGGRVDTQA